MGKQKTSRDLGLIIGDVTVGLALESALDDMKPGQVRVVGSLRKLIVRYSLDETVTIVDAYSGKELYRG